ncbi:MAG: tetratricopeptide repeat protein, partial [Woeseiaceae bacterium]
EDDTIEGKPEKMQANPQLKLSAIIHATGSKLSHSELIKDRAILFHWGLDGVERNIVKAIGLYRKAADMGNIAAASNLCEILSDNQDGQADYAEAVQWCLNAAQKGSSKAQARIGHLYTFGKGVDADLEEAEEWYRKATDTAPASRQNFLLDFHADLGRLVNDSSLPAKTRQEALEKGMKLFQEIRSEKR